MTIFCQIKPIEPYFWTNSDGFRYDRQGRRVPATAESGSLPSIEAVAEKVGATPADIKQAYARLRASQLLLLEGDGVTIRMAPPFSGVPTQHRVTVDGIEYYANCAWDALGIPAALHRPGVVRSRCEQSLEPLASPGRPGWAGALLVALSLPRPRGEVVGRPGVYLKQHAFLPVGRTHRGVVPGPRSPARPVVRMDQLWQLAKTWYSTRLEPVSRRPGPAEMRSIFESLGLEGDFWDPRADSF